MARRSSPARTAWPTGKENSEYAGDEIQNRVDEQDVHGDFHPATGSGGENLAGGPARKVHHRLSQQGIRIEGDHPALADAYGRNRRYFRTGVRCAPQRAAPASGLHEFVLEAEVGN